MRLNESDNPQEGKRFMTIVSFILARSLLPFHITLGTWMETRLLLSTIVFYSHKASGALRKLSAFIYILRVTSIWAASQAALNSCLWCVYYLGELLSTHYDVSDVFFW